MRHNKDDKSKKIIFNLPGGIVIREDDFKKIQCPPPLYASTCFHDGTKTIVKKDD